jgi:hypothetical protein
MKLFDIDWADFLDLLPLWEQLSLGSRRAFATLRSDNRIAISALEGQDRLLVEAGLIGYGENQKKVRLEKRGQPFARVIRAMMRHDLLKKSSVDDLQSYLRDHFTNEDLYSLDPASPYRYSMGPDIAHSAVSVEWIEKLLDKKEAKKKESRRPQSIPSWLILPDAKSEAGKSKKTLLAEQTMLRHLMSLTAPLPFRDLKVVFPELAPRLLADALLQGIGDLAFFPAMHMDDMTPVLGLWPSITRRLHRIKSTPPGAVDPEKSFHAAFLMEDMTTLLVAAASGSVRLRGNDYSLFAKAQQEIESNMLPLYDWVTNIWNIRRSARVNAAKSWLKAVGLAKNTGTVGKDLRLQITPLGEAWLAETPKERLKKILDLLINPTKKAKNSYTDIAPIYETFDDDDDDDDDSDYCNDYDDDYFDDDSYSFHDQGFDFFPLRLETSDRKDYRAEFRNATIEAFASVNPGEFLPVDEFLRWHSEENNPLVELFKGKQKPRIYGRWSYREPTREELDELWFEFLRDFLVNRLFILGGIRLGVTGDAIAGCFSLTDIGRYFLGIGKDFDYGQGQEGQGHVVVQPNFDIVFLSPSPLAEATISRFAERKARGHGTLFVITKKSILAAAGSGITVSQVLDTLKNASSKPIPANVEREIAGWFDQCRRIQVRSSILIHCPDAETAGRVLAAGGKKTVAITETVVELLEAKAKAEILRKLQGSGVFIGPSTTKLNPPHRLSGSRQLRR